MRDARFLAAALVVLAGSTGSASSQTTNPIVQAGMEIMASAAANGIDAQACGLAIQMFPFIADNGIPKAWDLTPTEMVDAARGHYFANRLAGRGEIEARPQTADRLKYFEAIMERRAGWIRNADYSRMAIVYRDPQNPDVMCAALLRGFTAMQTAVLAAEYDKRKPKGR